MRGTSRLAEQLLASQDGLCSLGLTEVGHRHRLGSNHAIVTMSAVRGLANSAGSAVTRAGLDSNK
jgi:hypothetical protein